MSKKLCMLALAVFMLLAVNAEAYNLTGKWQGNDGGIYYIRQLGNTIWWYGENSPNNPSWSNVANGHISGNMLNLQWSDVPKGSIMNNGNLTLEVLSEGKIVARNKTGGFGGSEWTKQGYVPPPSQPQRQKVFQNPKYNGYIVDICLHWARDCEKPAADKFCQTAGFSRAKSWKIAHDIGHKTPTIVIGDNKVCNQSFCDGFSVIECE